MFLEDEQHEETDACDHAGFVATEWADLYISQKLGDEPSAQRPNELGRDALEPVFQPLLLAIQPLPLQCNNTEMVMDEHDAPPLAAYPPAPWRIAGCLWRESFGLTRPCRPICGRSSG